VFRQQFGLFDGEAELLDVGLAAVGEAVDHSWRGLLRRFDVFEHRQHPQQPGSFLPIAADSGLRLVYNTGSVEGGSNAVSLFCVRVRYRMSSLNSSYNHAGEPFSPGEGNDHRPLSSVSK